MTAIRKVSTVFDEPAQAVTPELTPNIVEIIGAKLFYQ
jgi:ABC-type arginine transport system ATPase subunit